MQASFYRSARAFRSDTGGASILGLVIGLILLSTWIAWSLRAHVSRYEVADSARLEVDRAAYPVQARVAGRVASAKLLLGQDVHAGDVLVELESVSEKLNLSEEVTRLETLDPQLDALKEQMATLDQGRHEERSVLTIAVEEARARYREAETQWKRAEQEAERARQLNADKLIAESEYQKAQADAQSKRAAADSLRIAVSRLDPELRVRESDREARRKQMLSDVAKLEAQMTTSRSTIKRLGYEIERRKIRAAVNGRLADCAVLHPGSYVNEGEKVAMILPRGDLRVVADFQPAAALGRVQAGQPATVRLQGFPWAEYGTLPARVTRVASEIRDGHVRVELALDSGAPSKVPLQHGLPGAVEVEVERVSPAALILRTAGEMAARR